MTLVNLCAPDQGEIPIGRVTRVADEESSSRSVMISPLSAAGSPDLLAAPRQGIERGMRQMAAAAENMANGDISPENVVQQIQAEVLVKANVVAARTADEILGSLIDTLA